MRTVSRGTYSLSEDGRQAYLTLAPDGEQPQTHTIPGYVWAVLRRAAAGDARLTPRDLMRVLRAGDKP